MHKRKFITIIYSGARGYKKGNPIELKLGNKRDLEIKIMRAYLNLENSEAINLEANFLRVNENVRTEILEDKKFYFVKVIPYYRVEESAQ